MFQQGRDFSHMLAGSSSLPARSCCTVSPGADIAPRGAAKKDLGGPAVLQQKGGPMVMLRTSRSCHPRPLPRGQERLAKRFRMDELQTGSGFPWHPPSTEMLPVLQLKISMVGGEGEVFHPSDHFRGPPLDPPQQVHAFPVLRAPELDAVLQYPQVVLRRAALNAFIPQPVLIPQGAPTQVQDSAFGLVEPHEVHTGPLLQLVQVPLDDIPSLRRVSRTTQLGVICKLAEGALDPTVYVIDGDIKQHWSQYRPLRDAICH
ncbi:hypothetical protein QYF61_004394 [Mycteria americana]|uniref:Uncharacterized protein n=1 Tax=Mycteria americana TaxID=33587 RepID=A0AAN7N4Y8_MYCAM|nr:hypothetical protein QYF61_004394 [Mycteria americana]